MYLLLEYNNEPPSVSDLTRLQHLVVHAEKCGPNHLERVQDSKHN